MVMKHSEWALDSGRWDTFDAVGEIDQLDLEWWETRRTDEGVRYDYDTNRNGRHRRSERGYY